MYPFFYFCMSAFNFKKLFLRTDVLMFLAKSKKAIKNTIKIFFALFNYFLIYTKAYYVSVHFDFIKFKFKNAFKKTYNFSKLILYKKKLLKKLLSVNKKIFKLV